MYAFVSHGSACEALRNLKEDGSISFWPPETRPLPLSGGCLSNQRDFKALAKEVDLRRLGLASVPVDLIVPNQAMRSRGKAAHFHVWSGPIPYKSMLRLDDRVLVSGPELAVAQFCGSQAKLAALLDGHARAVKAERETVEMLGLNESLVLDNPLARDSIERLVAATVLACEFAGTYRLAGEGGETRYGVKALMTKDSMNRVLSELQGTSNKTRAAEVAGLFYERSASPMETALALMLTLPVNLGGMGLPRPELNASVDVSWQRGVISDRNEVKPDLLWRSKRIAIEYDSAEFHEKRGSHQLAEDARRSNILAACGYRIIRVVPDMINTLSDVELLARQVASLMGTELAQPNEIQALRRRRLLAMLMPCKTEE